MTGTSTPIDAITQGEGRRPVARMLSLSTAADEARTPRRRDGGLNRAGGFDPTGTQAVRHLVIFPAPVL
jgi:hypothetical protein